jgi:hypothetical protein
MGCARLDAPNVLTHKLLFCIAHANLPSTGNCAAFSEAFANLSLVELLADVFHWLCHPAPPSRLETMECLH